MIQIQIFLKITGIFILFSWYNYLINPLLNLLWTFLILLLIASYLPCTLVFLFFWSFYSFYSLIFTYFYSYLFLFSYLSIVFAMCFCLPQETLLTPSLPDPRRRTRSRNYRSLCPRKVLPSASPTAFTCRTALSR